VQIRAEVDYERDSAAVHTAAHELGRIVVVDIGLAQIEQAATGRALGRIVAHGGRMADDLEGDRRKSDGRRESVVSKQHRHVPCVRSRCGPHTLRGSPDVSFLPVFLRPGKRNDLAVNPNFSLLRRLLTAATAPELVRLEQVARRESGLTLLISEVAPKQ
jgi:hypothetical protein